jgi:hypothetical protein
MQRSVWTLLHDHIQKPASVEVKRMAAGRNLLRRSDRSRMAARLELDDTPISQKSQQLMAQAHPTFGSDFSKSREAHDLVSRQDTHVSRILPTGGLVCLICWVD